MFTIYITLKSFESYYIKKNIIFLKNLLLLTKNNTLNINEMYIKDILGQNCIEQIEKKRRLKTSDKLSLQYSTSKKTVDVLREKRGFLCASALSYAKFSDMHKIKDGIQDTRKTTLDSYVKIEEILTENENLPTLLTSTSLLLNFARSAKLRSEVRSRSALLRENEKKINEINLPVKQKLFTVLRSVHVHKKSRLQFHFTWYIKKLTLRAVNIKMMFLILYLLKNAKFYGVELEISLDHKTV